MHYFAMTTLTYTYSWRKQHEVLNMLHPLNPSNDIGMAREHGKHSPANMLGKTSGRLKLRSKKQLLHTCVWRGQSNFSLEHFISQHRNAYVSMSACAEHIQYQFPNEILSGWLSYLMQFNVLMQDYRPQWLVSRQTMVHMVCRKTLREPSHIYYHMNPVAKKRATGN